MIDIKTEKQKELFEKLYLDENENDLVHHTGTSSRASLVLISTSSPRSPETTFYFCQEGGNNFIDKNN